MRISDLIDQLNIIKDQYFDMEVGFDENNLIENIFIDEENKIVKFENSDFSYFNNIENELEKEKQTTQTIKDSIISYIENL